MFELILIYVLSRLNGVKAQKKGYKFSKYFWRTLILFISGELLGIIILTIAFVQKGLNITKQEEAVKILASNPMYYLMVLCLGIGGYLWVRYQIEQLPPQQASNDNDIKWG